MRLETGYEGRKARVEIVPLIDVVFLLLVFFIYAMLSMAYYRGITVDLPGGTADADEPADSFIITIEADNSMSVDKTVMGMSAIVAKAVAECSADRRILLYADRQAELGVTIELLSRLRNAGMKSVSFVVKEDNE